MRPTFAPRRLALIAASTAALALLAFALLGPARAQAQSTIPFKAFGAGRTAGEVVRALKGSTVVGQSTVNASGTWEIDVFLGGAAEVANGNTLNFTVNGAPAKETVTFVSGLFTPPPGLTLTLAASATPTPVATYAPATGAPGFAAPPVFSSQGQALAVFKGGTVDDLGTAAKSSNASGIWLQTRAGTYVVYIIGGPAFLSDAFRAAFPSGVGANTAVTLVR